MPIGGGQSISTIAELLREVFEPGFTEALNRSNALFQFFKRDSFPGKEIRWKIHYEGNNSAQSYSENDPLPNAGRQQVKNASVPYRMNWVTVRVTNFAIAAARGEGGYVDLWAFETREALEDLKNEINRQLMVRKKSDMLRPTDLDGIGVIVDDGQIDSTVTGYAGIPFSTNPWWKPYVSRDPAGSPRALTIAMLQRAWENLAAPPRRARTDRIITSLQHYHQYGDLLASLRRYTANETLDGGYPSLAFNGVKFTGIPELPPGDIYLLQTGDWAYYVLQNFKTEEKPIDGDARSVVITHYSQLVCRALHRQGRISDLQTV